ncbi:hypothetical protein DRN97_08680, partial [Methanosarcinales archaeon]
MNKMWRIGCLFLVAVFLTLAVVSGFAGVASGTSSSTEQIKTPSEIVNAIKQMDIHIPTSWNNSEPKQPFLLHKIVDGEIVPFFWVVPFEKNGKTIGLIGLDPYTGEFCWRVEGNANLDKPSEQILKSSLAAQNYDSTDFSIDKMKLVYIGPQKGCFWVIPKKNAPISEHIMYSIKTGRVKKMRTELQFKTLDAKSSGFVGTGPINQPPIIKLNPTKKYDKNISPYASSSVDKKSKTDWMKGKVPYYYQDKTGWCWACCLAMHHQWFSPRNLGNGATQTSEIAHYLNKLTSEGATLEEVHDVMTHWDDVDEAMRDLDFDYENYQLTYVGEGNHPIQDGSPTGYTNDLKTWIMYAESPIICGINSKGGGSGSYIDHDVLVIGYNDSEDVIYVHNPGYFSDDDAAISYNYWNNNLWSAVWWGKTWLPGAKRYGMCAGIPGDNKLIRITDSTIEFSDYTIYDDEKEKIYDIGMTIGDDNSAAGWDSFHDTYYEDQIKAELKDKNAGETSTPVGKGDFWAYSPDPPDSWIYFGVNGIPKGSTIDDAYFHIKPKKLGDIWMNVVWKANDEDDRIHSDDTITVSDDRNSVGGSMSMMKPIKIGAPQHTGSYFFHVEDDDTTGPNLDDYADDGNIDDSDITPYVIATKWSDTSGISLVEYRYKFGSGSWSSWESGTQLGSNWHYEIPRSEWINHIGKTLYWEARATDNDNDRPNDKSTSYSGTKTGGLISDDDTTPPSISNMKSEPASPVLDSHNSYIRLKADITDPSGISDVDFKYRYNGGSWKTKNPSGHSGNTYWYDIPKSEWKDHVGDKIHWKVIATDDDNDRSGDTETGSKTGPDIQLKDVTPPQTTITDGPTGKIDYSDVTFKWTGSDTVTSTSNLVYSYKLDGYDTSWSSWTSDTSKSYKDLPNKDYTFKVKAKDEAGNEDPTPAERSFRVDVTRSYTFQTTNNAMQITVDGTIYNSPCTVKWDDGTTHNVNVPPEQAIITGQSKYAFTHWSGKSSSTSTSLQITAGSTTAGTYTANYKTQYYLTVNTEPAGITSISGSGWYDTGSTATTGKAPDNADEYEFSTWKVDGNPVSGNPISVTMNDAHTATACYVPIGKPDLTLSPGDITFSNSNPTEGDIVKITATVHNIGNKDANSANVKFYDGNPDDGGTQIGVTQSISDIPPSGPKDASVNWDTTGKAGEHTIYVVIADCSPEEASTENNEASKDIFIRRYGVDLSCANPEKSIPSGGYALYDITVKNTGNIEDTINLILPPPCYCGWVYTLDKSSVELLPGESTVVVLNVSDVIGHPAESYREVEVIGTSMGDSTKSDSVLTKTTVGDWNPWNDPDSDGGESITTAELQEA